MVRTRVGYAGGQKKNPTYHDLGDHTETLQIDFDPTQVTYETLLDTFWKTHNPCAKAYSRQYMSAIFYHNAAQKRLAETTRDRAAEMWGKSIATALLPATEFTLAEAYHQKYMLRRHRALFRDFRAMYPDETDLVHSMAAAKVNGYLGGHGAATLLAQEIDAFGLSEEGRQALLERCRR